MKFAIQLGLSHPLLAVQVGLGRISQEQAFARMLAGELPRLTRRYEDLRSRGWTSLQVSGPDLQRRLSALVGRRWPRPPMTLSPWHAFLYLAARELKPSVVVETGVWYGWSSAALLLALHDNGAGKLFSVDLPPEQHRDEIDSGKKVRIGLHSKVDSVGSSIPNALRDRWELHLGDALEVLPGMLREVRPISMFIHDSLHTYEHMTAEYGLGYAALEDGGLLVSDDIDMNSAWTEFCSAHALAPVPLTKGGPERRAFGFAFKPRLGPPAASVAPGPDGARARVGASSEAPVGAGR